jgi:hypothetical protein
MQQPNGALYLQTWPTGQTWQLSLLLQLGEGPLGGVGDGVGFGVGLMVAVGPGPGVGEGVGVGVGVGPLQEAMGWQLERP